MEKRSFTRSQMNESSITRGLPIALLAAVLLAQPSTAHAYVDPGSGSAIVTAILGFFAAIGYTFRKFFYSLKRKGSGEPSKANDEAATAAKSGATPGDKPSGSSSDA